MPTAVTEFSEAQNASTLTGDSAVPTITPPNTEVSVPQKVVKTIEDLDFSNVKGSQPIARIVDPKDLTMIGSASTELKPPWVSPGTVPDPSEVPYINQRFTEVINEVNQMPTEAKAKVESKTGVISDDNIRRAEFEGLRGIKERDPQKYEDILYTSEAEASVYIENKLGVQAAQSLFSRINKDVGDILETNPNVPQLQAAAGVIATLRIEDPILSATTPDVYGRFHEWILACFDLAKLSGDKMEARRMEARQKLMNKPVE